MVGFCDSCAFQLPKERYKVSFVALFIARPERALNVLEDWRDLSVLGVFAAWASQQSTVELAHVELLKDARPIVLQVMRAAEAFKRLERHQIDHYKEEQEHKEHELDDLDVGKVLRHEFV